MTKLAGRRAQLASLCYGLGHHTVVLLLLLLLLHYTVLLLLLHGGTAAARAGSTGPLLAVRQVQGGHDHVVLGGNLVAGPVGLGHRGRGGREVGVELVGLVGAFVELVGLPALVDVVGLPALVDGGVEPPLARAEVVAHGAEEGLQAGRAGGLAQPTHLLQHLHT